MTRLNDLIRFMQLVLPALVFVLLPARVMAQVDSPVFREYHKPQQLQWAPSRLPGMGKQVYQFNLLLQANNGEAAAQNDIGLRYLFGDGFQKDTATAVMWIRKAAAQNLYSAHYNMGLFYNHGIGVPWNPYTAFEHFKFAAQNGERNAQYALGLMFTDDLVVPRNWKTAYTLLRRASLNGVQYADEVIALMLERGYITPADTSQAAPGNPPPAEPAKEEESPDTRFAWTPIFLDLNRDTAVQRVDIQTLVVEAGATTPFTAEDSLQMAAWLAGGSIPDSALEKLRHAALAGNPEATVLLGRIAEDGLVKPADPLLALQYYAHAIYLDSWRAGGMLAHLFKSTDINAILTPRSNEQDAAAMTVWSLLKLLRIDHRLGEARALELLTKAAEGGNIIAMVHLGMCHASGIWTAKSAERAAQWWRAAAAKGSLEAESRLAAEKVLDGQTKGYSEAIAVLENAEWRGSLLAAVALAYAYETGKGYIKNTGDAVRYYRQAAVRGSRNAHEALQELYGNARPEDWDRDGAGKITLPTGD